MYSPKIDEGLIPRLYRLAKARKIPMTRLVDELLRSAIGECDEDLPDQGSTHEA
jgi:hypothetical protein